MKDIFLLIPAVIFIWKSDDMHVIWNRTGRNLFLSISVLILLLYCFNNFYWNLPHKDFRPFKKGTNIAEQKRLEEEALANVRILSYKLENKESGEQVELPYAEYLKSFQQYPSEEWKIEQVLSQSTIESSKISEFDISDLEGNSMTDEILEDEEPAFLIIAQKLYGDGIPGTRIIRDTVYQTDTIRVGSSGRITLENNIASIEEKTENFINYLWKDFYSERYQNTIKPFVSAAMNKGIKVVMIIGGAGEDQILDFEEDIKLEVKYAVADDILLKTIIRANPGVVLIRGGKILDKWHFKQLPLFEKVEIQYLSK